MKLIKELVSIDPQSRPVPKNAKEILMEIKDNIPEGVADFEELQRVVPEPPEP